jgi:hypothetical protein
MQKETSKKTDKMTINDAISHLKQKWEGKLMTPEVALHCLKTIDSASSNLTAPEYYELKKVIFDKVQMTSQLSN